MSAKHQTRAVTERVAEGVGELVEWAHNRVAPSSPWELVTSRNKLGKTIFEVDEDGRRIVGKVSTSGRANRTFESLRNLWDAGLRPPSRYKVPQPVAWLPERSLLLVGKAEGEQLLELIRQRHPGRIAAAEGAALWLHQLVTLNLQAPPSPSPVPHLERCRTELAEVLPEHRRHIEQIADELAGRLRDGRCAPVPSHGDYHALNVFYSEDGCVTVIDLDTFGAREPAADTGYFVAQTAVMGFGALGDIDATLDVREAFLSAAPPAPEERVDAHVRFAFLRTLHYDLCILKVRDRRHVLPFLHIAAHGLA